MIVISDSDVNEIVEPNLEISKGKKRREVFLFFLCGYCSRACFEIFKSIEAAAATLFSEHEAKKCPKFKNILRTYRG